MRLRSTLSRKKPIRMLMAVASMLLVPVISQGGAITTLGFTSITNNIAGDVMIGKTQIFVDVMEMADPTKVQFKFYNNGPYASSITQIYFDDGTLVANPTITNGTGVDYHLADNAGNLPGGNDIDFTESQGFEVDPYPPVQKNGVNPGEHVLLTFDLQSGKTYADTLAALVLGFNNPGVDMVGGLRIGIHVQGFASGGSESFINVVPEPGTLLLLGSGLAGLALTGARKKSRK